MEEVWNWVHDELTTVPATVKSLAIALKVGKAAAVGAAGGELKGEGSTAVTALAVLEDTIALGDPDDGNSESARTAPARTR